MGCKCSVRLLPEVGAVTMDLQLLADTAVDGGAATVLEEKQQAIVITELHDYGGEERRQDIC